MNHCETCKHWQRLELDKYWLYEDCGLPAEELGGCAMAENRYDDPSSARPRETLAWAEDGESYIAGLTTHKTFGCVQWQPKEP